LIANIGAAQTEFAAWRKEHGLSDELMEKFNNSLSPEDKQRAAAEREEWERQLKHDLDAAVEQAQPRPTAGKPRRARSYM
jgi:hypothetical protein